MKKILSLLAIFVAANSFAHHQFIYTDTLDVTGKSSVPFKILFGHPDDGGEEAPIPVGKIKDKFNPAKEVFTIHNGEKMDITSKVKDSMLKTDGGEGRTFDFVLDAASGLKGAGDWVIVGIPGETIDDEINYKFNSVVKTVITKDGSKGKDWRKRVAEGHYEIIPFINPSKVVINSAFKGRLVDKAGMPVKDADISVDFVNGDLNLEKNTFTGTKYEEKAAIRTYTDENGYFVVSLPYKGIWAIRGKGLVDSANKYVEDTSLLIEVK